MEVIADVVLSSLTKDVSQKTQKEYYLFEGVVVGCKELPLLSGIALKKFITLEVYEEFCTLTQDRFDCSIGISRAPVNGRDCDLGFRLFINGFPRDEAENYEVDGLPDNSQPKETGDKNIEKGGKK